MEYSTNKSFFNRRRLTFPRMFFYCLVYFGLASGSAFANGLADLQSALSRLQGTTAVSAEITNRFEQSRGSDDDVVVKNGLVKIKASDGENGLTVFYNAATLKLMDEESKAKAEDEDVETPTLMGLNNNMGTMDMRLKFSSAAHLEKRLMQATFVAEEDVEYQGQNLRKLKFDLPINAIISDKTTRKYVDKFDAFYNIIIDDVGNPVESELFFKGRGRAYIVLSVKAEVSNKSTYQVYGERLLQITNDYQGKFASSLWPDSEYSGGHELKVIETEEMLVKHP